MIYSMAIFIYSMNAIENRNERLTNILQLEAIAGLSFKQFR